MIAPNNLRNKTVRFGGVGKGLGPGVSPKKIIDTNGTMNQKSLEKSEVEQFSLI